MAAAKAVAKVVTTPAAMSVTMSVATAAAMPAATPAAKVVATAATTTPATARRKRSVCSKCGYSGRGLFLRKMSKEEVSFVVCASCEELSLAAALMSSSSLTTTSSARETSIAPVKAPVKAEVDGDQPGSAAAPPTTTADEGVWKTNLARKLRRGKGT